jgi:hypothetical protein
VTSVPASKAQATRVLKPAISLHLLSRLLINDPSSR